MKVYWGDLHAHCSVSYGEGTVAQALLRARQQLDFCSITGHAFWPDMPTDRERYGPIIDYHREGFARLARNWPRLLAELQAAHADEHFVTFPSYEWHSLQYGDHNIYSPTDELPLQDAPDLPALRQVIRPSSAIAVPHHIGYRAGFRGIDWDSFESEQSPIVEIFSLHGASVSEEAAYPMLHDMGPRDIQSTAVAGWDAGHRFGIIASTDHHGGFPGSYGDGRAAVLAERLTREALWEAILQRRVYAVTGDKIVAQMTLNDAPIGSIVQLPANRSRHVRLSVRGRHAVDRVELLKNNVVVQRFFPDSSPAPDASPRRFRLRIEWGWGRKDQPVAWQLSARITDGNILSVEPCFSGQSIVAPQGVAGHSAGADEDDLPHQIVETESHFVQWRSVTTGNLSTRHPTHQALILDVEAGPSSRIIVQSQSGRYEHSLEELLYGGHVHYQHGWLSEALRIGPLVPESACCVEADWKDADASAADAAGAGHGDRYRLRVAQTNQQRAWLTPIWVA